MSAGTPTMIENQRAGLGRSVANGALGVILSLLFPFAAEGAIPSGERDALFALHQSTGGASWTRSDGWLGAAGTECTWYGVVCNDSETAVDVLELQGNNLRGEIPTSINGLTHVRRLTLNDNTLSGSLPSTIGSLAELEELYLSNNSISGELPPSIGLLSRLVLLDMSENRIEDPLPSTIAQLSSLRDLFLAGNQLSGALPAEFFQLRGLERVSFERNQLTGGIASFTQLNNLLELDLTSNQFDGPIPRELAQLTRLESLVLRGNQFKGLIPAELGSLANLQNLDLSSNPLEGGIPPQLGSLSALRYLALAQNQLTGEIPPQLMELRELLIIELSGNALTGPIPPAIRQLTKLEDLYLYDNQLTGPIPPELMEIRTLQEIFFFHNQLTGRIPSTISNLINLEQFSVGDNDLDAAPFPIEMTNLAQLQLLDLSENSFEGEIPAEISRLSNLQYLSLNDNRFSGTIKPQLFQFPLMLELRLERNALSGTIPRDFTGLPRIELLDLFGNQLEGEIPPELGNVRSLLYLLIGGNRLRGVIPSEIGQLSNLLVLGVEENQLTGLVPVSITNLTSLTDGESGFAYNLLFTDDPAVRSFLDRKQGGGDFALTQTLPPTEFQVSAVRGRSAILSWKPIRYIFDEGGYQITASRTANGEPVAVETTASKDVSSALIEGLDPTTQYFFKIRSVTYPHDTQQNELTSDPAPTISATTLADVPLPPLVVATALPTGMFQQGSTIEKDDYVIFTNFGDLPTTVTLARTGTFFELDPIAFDIEPGDDAFVSVTPLVQQPGVFNGAINVSGVGVPAGLSIPVTLLAAGAEAGNVIAVPSATRVDVSGELRGSVSFTNIGTAPLAGVMAADSPWILTSTGGVTIPPQGSAVVEFTIDPSERPDGEDPAGSVTGNLSLLYLSDSAASKASLAEAKDSFNALPPGVSASATQVVHTVVPVIGGGIIPTLGAGEVARFIPGVAHLNRRGFSLISDLFIANSLGQAPLSDLRLFFTSPGASGPRLASLPTVFPSSFIQLGDVVKTVYGNSNGSGSLIVRTSDWSTIGVSARLQAVRSTEGRLASFLPIFRSDRSAGPGESFALAGVSKSSSTQTDLFVQETSGQSAMVTIEFFNAEGTRLGSRPADTLAPYGLLEVLDAAPEGAVSATVTNEAASAGRIAAYAQATDTRTGDSWITTEWSRYFGFDLDAFVRLPLISASTSSSGRRRPVRRGTSAPALIEPAAQPIRESSDVTIFNPDSGEAEGTIFYVENGGRTFEQTFQLGGHASLLLRDVTAQFAGTSALSTGQLIIEPSRGRVAATGRRYKVYADGFRGSEVPAVEAFSGLRLGQSRLFAGVEDAAPSSVTAQTPGSTRSDLVFSESDGASITVRVRVLYSTSRSVFATLQSREFRIGPREVVTIPNLSAAVIGSSRDRLGDLHNVQVQVDALSGDGAVTVMLISTDNGSGDSVLRLE